MADKRERLLLPLVGAIVSVGFIPLSLLPFTVVGLTSGLGLDPSAAGMLGTVELGSAAIGSLIATPFLRSGRRTRIAIWAILFAIALEIASCVAHSLPALILVRGCVGLGCGLALGAGNAIAASVADPSRFYMKVLAFESALTTMTWGFMPTCLSLGQQVGVFIGSAVALLLLLVVTLFTASAEADRTTKTHRILPTAPSTLSPLARVNTALVLAAVFLCCVRDGLAWTLTDKIGTDLSLSSGQQTVLFAAIGAIGVIGLLASARMDTQRRLFVSVVVSVAAASLITTAILLAQQATTYVALSLPWTAIEFIAFAFLTGMAAQVDPSGRVAAASGAAFQAGYAIAPLFAGSLFSQFGYTGVAALSAAVSILTVAIGGWLAIRLSRRPAAASSSLAGVVTD